MRLFQNLEEALREIRRDLSKAPRIYSTRVQNLTHEGAGMEAREAMGYHYMIMPDGIPSSITEAVEIAADVGVEWYQSTENQQAAIQWGEKQWVERFGADWNYPARPSDLDHPALAKVTEGDHFSYLYQERMVGAIEALKASLERNPDTRRAYWPIFQHNDAIRACFPTRIPCSLGIHLMRREIPGDGERLHAIYLQRSADYEVFLTTDIVLWRRFQVAVANDIHLRPGGFEHFISSLHWFNREGREVY